MNIELLLFGFGCGVAGIVIGLVVANMFRADNELLKKVKAELAETQEKLKRQADHFAESENMMHKLGTDLKNLYQHMSQNEISTLKEKFKGLVIDADASLDKLMHKDKAAEEAVEKSAGSDVDNIIAKTNEETAEGKVKDLIPEDVESKEEAKAEVVVAEQSDAIVTSTVETSDEIKDKINETIDELAGKNKKD